jgi:hypothetical protein
MILRANTGKRWGSRSHKLANPGTWDFQGAKLDGLEFLFGMGSDAVPGLAICSAQNRKTGVIMQMGIRWGLC